MASFSVAPCAVTSRRARWGGELGPGEVRELDRAPRAWTEHGQARARTGRQEHGQGTARTGTQVAAWRPGASTRYMRMAAPSA
eukprot:scaffold10250_cov48-Phaeocystis_antarctica.AAC.1